MAFEQLKVVRYASAKNGEFLPASMSVSRKGSAVKVSLMPDLAAKGGIVAKARFDVMIGKGDDAGKLRIVARAKGNIIGFIVKRSGGVGFHLGLQPAIGTAPHKSVRTDARVIEPGCVEVDIPDFAGAGGRTDEDDETDTPAAPTAPATGGGTRKLGNAGITFNGVTMDLTEDEESVSFKGKSTEVTTRQAKLVQLLARPRPAPVAESFLIGALWDGKPPAGAGEQLRTMAADLQKGLSPIGLDLRHVKGAGYQLRDL